MIRNVLIGIALTYMVPSAIAQKLTVKIIGRENNETDYTYVVPGRSVSNSSTNVNCSGGISSVNCSESTRTTEASTPAQQVSYRVRGATFSLQLSDGRVVVVNCESKFSERMAGRQGNHRSCRMPLVDEIEVEFGGDKAKLKWPVSIDGKKLESETYKILAMLTK